MINSLDVGSSDSEASRPLPERPNATFRFSFPSPSLCKCAAHECPNVPPVIVRSCKRPISLWGNKIFRRRREMKHRVIRRSHCGQSSFRRTTSSFAPSFPTTWPIRFWSWICCLGRSAGEPDEHGYCFDFVSSNASGMVKLA